MFPCALTLLLVQLPATSVEPSFHVVRLNRALVDERAGDVLDCRPSPDGAWIAFRATQGASTDAQLFLAPADGSAPPYAPATPVAGGALAYRFSPDGERIVYSLSTGGLYAARIGSSATPVLLSSGFPFPTTFVISPDSQHVVYWRVAVRNELFSTPIDGSAAPVRLDVPALFAPGVLTYALAPDSESVVFRSTAERSAADLYAVPIAGGAAPLRLDPPLPSGQDVAGFEFAPDGSEVVYWARQDSATDYELYSVPITGGATLKLSNTTSSVTAARVSPDGVHAVYLAEHLYSAPLAGGAQAQLSNAGAFADFVITADSTSVLYRAGPLFRVPIAGGTRTNVSTQGATRFALDEASARVVFASGTHGDLYSVPALGGPALRLSPDAPFQIGDFAVDAASARVAFLRGAGSFTEDELWSAPIDGATLAVPMSPPRIGGYGVLSYQVGAGRAFFVGDYDFGEAFQLYRAWLDGSAPPVPVNDPIPATGAVLGDVDSFLVSPRGDRVLYFADQAIDEKPMTYSVPSAGGDAFQLAPATGLRPMEPVAFAPDGSFVLLHGWVTSVGEDLVRADVEGAEPPLALTTSHNVKRPILLSPDGGHVVYTTGGSVWTVATDGSSPPVHLAASGFTGSIRTPDQVAISPDGTRIVFAPDQDTGGRRRHELYSSPIDGGSPAVPLHPSLPTGGSVWHFTITPDSTGVVFSARQSAVGSYELFHAPIDGSAGSASPLRISLPGPRDVLASEALVRQEFQVAPDSRTVVYLAGRAPDDSYELYAVPIDGGPGGRRLNPELVPGGNVLVTGPVPDGQFVHATSDFQIAADGRHVVYEADQRVNGVVELFAVELPELSGHLLPDGPLHSKRLGRGTFQITPDGQTVVYRKPQLNESLFRVPITGGPSTLLGDATDFTLDAEGTGVLFSAGVPPTRTLYVVPLDVSHPAVRVNDPRVSGPGVTFAFSFTPRFGPDGRRIFYLAEKTPGAVELFSATPVVERGSGL